MRGIRNGVVALAATLALAACGGTGEVVEGMPAPASAVAVEVANSNWSDVTVYADVDGQSQRLGMVTTNQTATFELPATMAGASNVRLRIEPIGSTDSFTTDALVVGPGDAVHLKVGNALRQSSWSIQ